VDGSTVLIAGANGFLGRNLIEHLGRTKARVVAVSRTAPADAEHSDRVRWIRLDLTDLESVRGLIRETQPDFIYHLASDSRGGREFELVMPSFRNDVQTTINLLLAAHDSRCRRLVMTASLEEPVVTDREPVPTSPYAAAKMVSGIYGRLFHSLYGLPTTILRPFMTYGPYQKRFKLIPYVIESLLEGRTAEISSGARLIDAVYVDDVITAFVTAATVDASVGRTIDLGTGVLVSIQQVAEQIRALIPNSPRLAFSAVNTRSKEVVRPADTLQAESTLGWKATTSLAEGLLQTINWYRSQLKDGLTAAKSPSQQ
jgi:nucleoside-diphosphate-sugar epimerase